MADELHVATLNLRNIADRWTERLPLLLADMAALQPDLIGLQECVFAAQQDRLLGAAGEGRYSSRRGWAGPPRVRQRVPRAGAARPRRRRPPRARPQSLGAEGARHAPDRAPRSTAVVTHLHHAVEDEAVRTEQAVALTAWLVAGRGPARRRRRLQRRADRADVPGDARRGLPLGVRRGQRRRAGRSPGRRASRRRAWTSTASPAASTTSGCAARSRSIPAALAFDRPAVDDPTLFPSDHFGLSARVRIGG